jgi:hypothetical protein
MHDFFAHGMTGRRLGKLLATAVDKNIDDSVLEETHVFQPVDFILVCSQRGVKIGALVGCEMVQGIAGPLLIGC